MSDVIFYSVITIVAVLFIIPWIVWWRNKTADQKIAALKEWLRYAVFRAEKELGSGTGQLKLRVVYDMAIEKFPWLVKIVSFEMFSDYVDDALVWMEDQLSKNNRLEGYVAGD